jgi:hypothetical protein
MAEIKSVVCSMNTPAEEVFEILKDCWEWEGFEKPESGEIILHVNENTQLVISGGEHPATLSINFKGNTVLTLGISSSGYSDVFHIVKTNTATLIQVDTHYTANVYQGMPFNKLALILSTATNHYTGIKEKVVSWFRDVSITGVNYNYSCICSKEINDTTLDDKSTFYGALANSNVSSLCPFFSKQSQVTLDDVYLFTAYQPSELYRGDCTINGRRYYVCNLIAVLDE